MLYIGLPSDYPFKSPSVGFRNKIFHPNVDWSSGTICLDVLNSKWTPVYGALLLYNPFSRHASRVCPPRVPICSCNCESLVSADLVNVLDQLLPQLLRYPNPSDPLNGEAAMLCLRQPERYRRRIGSVIEEFANEAAVQSIMKNDLGLSMSGGPGPDRLELPPAAASAAGAGSASASSGAAGAGAARRSVSHRFDSRRFDDDGAEADADGRVSAGNVSMSTRTANTGSGGGSAAADGSGHGGYDDSSEASLSDDDGDSDISELSDY